MSDQPTHEHVERRLIEAARLLAEFRAEVGEVCDDDWRVEYTRLLLDIVNVASVAAEECVRSMEKPGADFLVGLWEDHFAGPDGASAGLGGLRVSLEGVAHDRLQAEGEVVLSDGRSVYPTWKKRRRTDGARLLAVLVAQAGDEFGGEPPAVFAEQVARKLDSCAGFTRPSHGWRKSNLERAGIALDNFTDTELGEKTIGFTRPGDAA